MKRLFYFLFLFIFSLSVFSANLGIYSNGVFLEFPISNIKVKAGYPTFGLSYNKNNKNIGFNLNSDFNLNNPQLNNYISTNLTIYFNNLALYSGLWNTFDLNDSENATTTKIGNFGFFTGITTNIQNLKMNISLNLKIMNWIKTGNIVTSLPAFKGTFEDAVFLAIGLDYTIPINKNNISIFFNFGANYINFPNGLTLYQFNNKYNFGILLTLNELFKQEE
ncbi:hypothetical protein [Marinitoga aeolica]|uniref:Outer membrane protein beta-barrel domain-containing protein n=1 Tax=Marinitoga aeolica TaxID=2809031 RepID=A0ABY8PRM4_9BACT|nr:hypothetical protein [Marinitoga aeolica]WGS65270.1 hypothetical protein JRV97_01550 [Marinitoga aeolica]